MCYALFALAIALLFYYSDTILQQHALTLRMAGGEWVTVALGWEMVQVLWPMLLLAAVVGSALTYLVPRLLRKWSPGR